MTTLHLAYREIRRWVRGAAIRPLALVVLALIPSLYGVTYLWSNWDPYGRMNHVSAALVNEDRPVTRSDGQRVAAGDQLTKKLLRQHTMDWNTVTAERAHEGLQDGDYALTLTVPRKFSSRISSPASGTPRQAHLSMELNDANGFIVDKLAQGLKGQLRAQVNSAAFQQYAKQSLLRQARDQQRENGKKPDRAAISQQARALSSPVHIDTDNLNPAGVYGRGLAPFFFSIALWVFGLVAYQVLRPLDKRALLSRVRPWSVALGGWLAATFLGVVSAWILFAIADAGLDLNVRHPWQTLGLMSLAVAAFVAIGQLCRALWGLAGAVVMLVLLMLQLTSCGGLYPVATTPLFFRVLHPAMPMTYLVDGLRVTLSGGETSHLVRDLVVLAGILVVFVLLTSLVALVQRRWSLGRLHPALAG